MKCSGHIPASAILHNSPIDQVIDADNLHVDPPDIQVPHEVNWTGGTVGAGRHVSERPMTDAEAFGDVFEKVTEVVWITRSERGH